jgi:hypothetical protein
VVPDRGPGGRGPAAGGLDAAHAAASGTDAGAGAELDRTFALAAEARQKSLMDAGTFFSKRLEEITYILGENKESTFEDVPHHLADGLVELARNYTLCFDAWKEIYSANLYGKSWNAIHKLEHAVIVSEQTNETQKGFALIKQPQFTSPIWL